MFQEQKLDFRKSSTLDPVEKSIQEIRTCFKQYTHNTLMAMLKYKRDQIVISSSKMKHNKKKLCLQTLPYGVARLQNKFVSNIYVNLIKKQVYLGSFKDEKQAALNYDIASIQLFGTGAKTNYDYTKEDILRILANDFLLNLVLGKLQRMTITTKRKRIN